MMEDVLYVHEEHGECAFDSPANPELDWIETPITEAQLVEAAKLFLEEQASPLPPPLAKAPAEGEKYWYAGGYEVEHNYWEDDDIDRKHFTHGIWAKEEDAQKWLEHFQKQLERAKK